MTIHKLFHTLLFLLFSFASIAQIGGRHVYEFLNLPNSARVTSLGGTLITVIDDDVSLAFENPAVVTDSMRHQLSFNHTFHFAGISHGLFNMGFRIPGTNFDGHAGIKYISYGDFVRADIIGNTQGNFSANELAIKVGLSHQFNERLRIGANLGFVSSNFESYNSTGITSDLGLLYYNKASLLSLAAVAKNIGFQITTYTDERLNTPLDIQIAISKRLRYLPFRLTITAHQLQQWDIRYDDPSVGQETDLFGNSIEESSFNNGIDNFFRHFIFSGEFLLGKKENLRLRVGYRHLMRQELSVEDYRSLAGFSMGFGLKISKFRIDYGLGYHHLAGAANHLSISTNLREFSKRF